eukprot:COSAG01_NODE_16182_length_1262_cov_1.239897_1_plen_110_part_00
MTARCCGDDFDLMKRLTKFVTTQKSLTGEQLASLVVRHLVSDLDAQPDQVTGWGRDSVAMNGVASARMGAFFPDAVDVMCVSHVLNCSMQHTEFRVLKKFVSWYITDME